MYLVKAMALGAGLLAGCVAAMAETSASIVDFETPLSRLHPLQGHLRQPAAPAPLLPWCCCTVALAAPGSSMSTGAGRSPPGAMSR